MSNITPWTSQISRSWAPLTMSELECYRDSRFGNGSFVPEFVGMDLSMQARNGGNSSFDRCCSLTTCSWRSVWSRCYPLSLKSSSQAQSSHMQEKKKFGDSCHSSKRELLSFFFSDSFSKPETYLRMLIIRHGDGVTFVLS